MQKERRQLNSALLTPKLEEREGKAPLISGYAAVYYDGTRATEYELWPGTMERIMPGAFDRCVNAKPDVRGLFNHDPNFPLGRTAAGTCRIVVDNIGLRYEIDPPDSEIGRTVTEALRRGDVSGSSFSFSLEGGEQRWVDRPDGSEIREISAIGSLYDVGPVTFPAYEGTSAFSRSEDAAQAKADLERYREDRRKAQEEARKRFKEQVERVTK